MLEHKFKSKLLVTVQTNYGGLVCAELKPVDGRPPTIKAYRLRSIPLATISGTTVLPPIDVPTNKLFNFEQVI